MTDELTPIGKIHVSPRAISTIAFHAVVHSYGVVGMTSRNLVNGISKVIVNDPSTGVDVRFDGDLINIDLYIIVEYGTRIKSVASSVANNVRYQVEKALGLPVNEVNVHVQGIRVSDPD